jgi:hypothetical protein
LVRAARTAAARRESVPASAAAIVEEFRIVTGRAKPSVGWFRLPFAQGTADTPEVWNGRFLMEFYLNILV